MGSAEGISGSTAGKIPVWLDVDTGKLSRLEQGAIPLADLSIANCYGGHDDVFAILIAGHHPTLNLLGVSTTHGNAPQVHTTVNTSSVLTAIGRTDVSVYPGTAKPFCRSEVATPDFEGLHGPTGLSGTTLLPEPTAPIVRDKNPILSARDALLAQSPHTAWVVVTGPCTNAALLFATFPEVADHIAGLSIMGGAVGGDFTDAPKGKVKGEETERFGNETPWAEFNIYVDPESARSILSNPVLAAKTTLITLDLTHLCLATKEVRQRLLHGDTLSKEPSLLRRLLSEILEHFAVGYDELFDISAGPPLHDPLAVAILFGVGRPGDLRSFARQPIIFEDDGSERYVVTLITAGEHSESDAVRGQVGMTKVDKLLKPDMVGDGVRIPRKLNVNAFWDMLEECCSIADKSSALNA